MAHETFVVALVLWSAGPVEFGVSEFSAEDDAAGAGSAEVPAFYVIGLVSRVEVVVH